MKISFGRERLIELAETKKYVFHGSGELLEELEPRQAYNHPHDSEEDAIPDGEPAVFATSKPDIAIFMSIFNYQNAPKGSRSAYDHDEKGLRFRVTKATMDQIHNAKGYVYVFDRNDFSPRGEIPGDPTAYVEAMAYKNVRPVEVVEVSEKDLPEGIEIRDAF